MTDFLSRGLLVLDRIYNFVNGDQGIRDMELGLPIQRVHDVSREAEIGSGLGGQSGYMIFAKDITHLGASTVLDSLDPWVALVSIGVARIEQIQNYWVWPIFSNVNSNNANLTRLVTAIAYPSSFPGAISTGGAPLYVPVSDRDYDITVGDVAGAATVDTWEQSASAGSDPYRPFPMTYGCTWTFKSVASGACVATPSLFAWVGPSGVTPPAFR